MNTVTLRTGRVARLTFDSADPTPVDRGVAEERDGCGRLHHVRDLLAHLVGKALDDDDDVFIPLLPDACKAYMPESLAIDRSIRMVTGDRFHFAVDFACR